MLMAEWSCHKSQGLALLVRLNLNTFTGSQMAKPNYSFEKRQKEIAKKKKQEEKRLKKVAVKDEQLQADQPQPPVDETSAA
jgi:hypothetical protein